MAQSPDGRLYLAQLPPAAQQAPGNVIDTVDAGLFMASKEYGWLSVGAVGPESYGAKADGVTDDTAAIQAAINAVAAVVRG